jgi:hypothetical protein
MNQTIDSPTYEFGLYLSEKDTHGLQLFNSTPPSIDDGLNGTFPEKIRRFNNSATFLVNSIINLENIAIDGTPLCLLCQDTPSEIDTLYRQLIRNVYMELFIYQEKLLNIVCNMFFVKVSKSRKKNIMELKKLMVSFPNLRTFCEECDKLVTDTRFQHVMSIRDDEIHNMSQIDRFIYDLKSTENGCSVVNKGYKIKAKTLHDDYIYAMEKLLNVRIIVQRILDEDNFWQIRKVLVEQGKEIWIN